MSSQDLQQWTTVANQLTVVAVLVIILVAGAYRLWVWGYIDKAKDAQIDRLQGILEKQAENFERALDLLEARAAGARD